MQTDRASSLSLRKLKQTASVKCKISKQKKSEKRFHLTEDLATLISREWDIDDDDNDDDGGFLFNQLYNVIQFILFMFLARIC